MKLDLYYIFIGEYMISREGFKKAIKAIEEQHSLMEKLDDANFMGLATDIAENGLIYTLISVLEESFNLYTDPRLGSTLSWWIYETKDDKSNAILYDDEEVIKLDTVDKLYDYLVEEGIQHGRENN